MNLATKDAQLFFKLFFGLLAYANRQLQVVPHAATPEDIPKAGIQKASKIRDALYDHPELFDRFIAENPERLTPEERSLVASWKHRVSGEFYLMRYLKKYAVFMPAKKADHLYGVLGLYDSFDTVLSGQPLPVLLKTTLLPFKSQIIYDGIAAPYTLLFGPGIRADLDASYKRLKQKEGIVEQLASPEGEPQIRSSLRPHAAKPAPDWRPAIDEMVAQTDRMRRADTPPQTAALGLLRAAAHLAQTAYEQPNELQGNLKHLRRALTRLETVLYEEDF